jgi:glucan 1,3-beta-glucosidase
LDTESCQQNIIDVQDSQDIYIWAGATKASSFMVTYNGYGVVAEADNDAGFCETFVLFEAVNP